MDLNFYWEDHIDLMYDLIDEWGPSNLTLQQFIQAAFEADCLLWNLLFYTDEDGNIVSRSHR
jgi:hypothetical protein